MVKYILPVYEEESGHMRPLFEIAVESDLLSLARTAAARGY